MILYGVKYVMHAAEANHISLFDSRENEPLLVSFRQSNTFGSEITVVSCPRVLVLVVRYHSYYCINNNTQQYCHRDSDWHTPHQRIYNYYEYFRIPSFHIYNIIVIQNSIRKNVAVDRYSKQHHRMYNHHYYYGRYHQLLCVVVIPNYCSIPTNNLLCNNQNVYAVAVLVVYNNNYRIVVIIIIPHPVWFERMRHRQHHHSEQQCHPEQQHRQYPNRRYMDPQYCNFIMY